jgi:hypothetical protein
MKNVEINKTINLSEHITLGEVTKSSHAEIYNIPSHVAIENLKRVCVWLEALRYRYNQRYVTLPLQGEMEEVTKPGRERPPLTPPVGGGLEEPLLLIAGTDLLN